MSSRFVVKLWVSSFEGDLAPRAEWLLPAARVEDFAGGAESPSNPGILQHRSSENFVLVIHPRSRGMTSPDMTYEGPRTKGG